MMEISFEYHATELHPEMYILQMAGRRIVVDSLRRLSLSMIEEALKFLAPVKKQKL
jgi:hypothetical protein